MAKECEGVTLLNGQNDSVSIYLDQNTHYPVKISYSWRDPKDKQKNVEEEIYDSYKLSAGNLDRSLHHPLLQRRDFATALRQYGELQPKTPGFDVRSSRDVRPQSTAEKKVRIIKNGLYMSLSLDKPE